MKKLIETKLPLKVLNQSAMAEKVRKGHPGNLHLWWNRSPIDSSAALLYAALMNVPSNPEGQAEEKADCCQKNEALSEEIRKIASGNKDFTLPDFSDKPVICDPFSGFGGLTIAAQKLGLPVQAGDLNPVAVLLTKASAEIPAHFAGQSAVNPDADQKISPGAESLAADIVYYGKWLKQQIEQKLSGYYPPMIDEETGEELQVFAWIWVRTVKCPNPACSCQMPLATSFVLSKAKDHAYWAEPVYNGKILSFKVHQGICPAEKENNKHDSKGSKFQCPVCGELTTDVYLKKCGRNNEIVDQLMAVCVLDPDGRIFVAPDQKQIEASKVNRSEDLPVGALPNNTRWFSTPAFGKTQYSDLYMPRQLFLMNTCCELLKEAEKKVYQDAVESGMSHDHSALSENEIGALAYSQAIGVYLALTISKMANFQSSICTWDNRTGNLRGTFSRQAIPMTWVFGEGNPFSSVTGNFDSLLRNTVDAVKDLLHQNPAQVQQADALTKTYPDNAILLTELPYYDHVGYADLSDYFYIWLRKCLKETYPALFEKVVTSKDELSSIPEHYGGSQTIAVEAYQEGIVQFFQNFYPAASLEYPSIVFFQYNKADDRMICGLEQPEKMTSLEQILDSIIQVGFQICALYPMPTDKPGSNSDSIRIAIVMRKTLENHAKTTKRNWINLLKRELPLKMSVWVSEDLEEADQRIIGIGCGLALLTSYEKVINADGSHMAIRDVLQIVNQELKNLG